MKTFYSLLYALITPETAEKISLGLLLSDGEKSLFRYSENKYRCLQGLVSSEQYGFVRKYLKTLQKETGLHAGTSQPLIFPVETLKPATVGESYIEYLSRYNQNVVSFGKPVNIDVTVTAEAFEKLFKVLLNEKEVPAKPLKGKLQSVKKEIALRANRYFTIDRKIMPEDLPDLIMPVTFDLLGRNEMPVYAKFLDFERALNHIKNDYFDISQLHQVLPKSKGFVVSTEPGMDKWPEQHSIWQTIRRSGNYQYIHAEDIEIVEEYARDHQVRPW